MIFTSTELEGVVLLGLDRHSDERGFFARTFCREEFAVHGLDSHVIQSSVSFTGKKGTLRGLHYQRAPHWESKVVRCLRGRVHDVVLDLRADSPSYLQHMAIDLDDVERQAIYVPPGCAHGFLTLTNDVEIGYQMSTPYVPDAQSGVRWDDPAFGIEWPLADPDMNERDRSYPDFTR